MCFQGFATCACGHVRLFESACELGTDVTFYFKPACPNYTYRRKQAAQYCGEPGLYCKETREGPFLEQVYFSLREVDGKLNAIDARGVACNAQAANFNRISDEKGIPQSARRLHPAYFQILRLVQTLKQQRTGLLQQRRALTCVLQEGRKYCVNRTVHGCSEDGNTLPPFSLSPQLRSELPAELMATLAALEASCPWGTAMAHEKIIGKGKPLKSEQNDFSGQNDDSNDTKVNAKPYNLSQGVANTSPVTESSLPNIAIEKRRPRNKHGGQTKQDVGESSEGKIFQVSEQHTDNTQTPERTSEAAAPRRSTRVRNKRINYAESGASTPHTQSSSPEKSEYDNFSPLKSEGSSSPEKVTHRQRYRVSAAKRTTGDNRAGHRHSSLGNLINEWNRRTDLSSDVAPFGSANIDYQHPEQNILAQPASFNTGHSRPSVRKGFDHAQAEVAARPTPSLMPGFQSSPRSEYLTRNQYGVINHTQHVTLPTNGPYSTPTTIRTPIQDSGTSGAPTTARITPYVFDQNDESQAPMFQQNLHQTYVPDIPSFSSVRALASAQSPMYNISANRLLNSIDDEHRKRDDNVSTAASNATLAHIDYGRMRRSFSVTAEFTPPASVGHTSANTDPKKRSLFPSSPLPSNTRMCPPHSGEDKKSVYGSSFPSSPQKPASQASLASETGHMSQQSQLNDELQGATAPILAPMALMYAPPQDLETAESAHSPTMVASSPLLETDVGIDLDAEHQSSDIGWGFINDSLFES